MSALFEAKFPLLREAGGYGKKKNKTQPFESEAHTETGKFNDETLKEVCEELSQLDLTDSWIDCFVQQHSASQHPSSRMINGTAPVPDTAKIPLLLGFIHSKGLPRKRA